MISIYVIFSILLIHWVADFCLQSDWQAKNKSKEWIALLSHTTIYSLCWVPFIAVIGNNNLTTTCLFVFITLICHTITDYFTSRLNTKLWNAGKTHNFFVSIGFDQVLHYVQLFLTYYLLTN